MRSPARLALAAVALATVVAIVWTLQGTRGGGRAGAAAAPVSQPSAAPASAPEAVPVAAPAAPAAPPAREEALAAADPEEPAESEPSAERALVLVDGRFVDPAGAPIEGVLLERGGKREASAADGSFRWSEDLGKRLRHRTKLSAYHPAFARRAIELELRRGQELHLGTIALDWGGSVSGRVVDDMERPVGGAQVACTLGDQSYSDWEKRQGPDDPLAEVESAADGRFVLDGLPPAAMRVWASAEGMHNALSDAVTVVAGRDTSGVDLVLVPLAPEDTLEVLVQEPGGAPVPNAKIQYSYKAEGMSGTGSTNADENGRWHHRLDVRATFDVIASDPKGRFAAAAASVEPGARGQVIHLGELRTIELAVSDESGAPIERWTATARPPERAWATLGEPTRSEAGSEGVARVPVPPLPFLLHVEAEDHDVTKLGPFEPARAPERLEVRLVSLPGVTGRVVERGEPLAGARVSLHEAVGDDQSLVVNGFRARSQRSEKSSATSSADGAFRLTLREPGRYFVRATHSGRAPAEIGPFEIAPRPGLHDLELDLRGGGAIEGRVLLPDGADGAGTVVGISRGDGFAVTQVAGTGGAFRFEDLTAGPWRVERRREALRDGSWSSSRSGSGQGPRDMGWNCTVRDGETTRFDLDLRFEVPAVLAGRLRLGGKAPAGWTASLHRQTLEPTHCDVGADGSFRLQPLEPGDCNLSLAGKLGGEEFQIYQPIELPPGETPWELDLALGRVEGQLATPLGEDQLYFAWQGAGTLRGYRAVRPDAQGRFTLAEVPAGKASLVRWGEESATANVEIDVPAGETAQVQIP